MKSNELVYEVKYPNKEDWFQVSETAFLRNLLQAFERITPVMRKMFEGNEIVTPSAAFRLGIRQGAKGVLIPVRLSPDRKALNC